MKDVLSCQDFLEMVEIWRQFDGGLRSAIDFESWLPCVSCGSTDFRQKESRSVFPDCTQMIEISLTVSHRTTNAHSYSPISVYLSPPLMKLWGVDHRQRVNESARKVSHWAQSQTNFEIVRRFAGPPVIRQY